jgi:hypothetical protein
MPKYNWELISSDYIEGLILPSKERIYPTLEEVANKYNIRPKTVREHAGKEHWRDKRTAFQHELEETARQLRLNKRAQEEAEFHENCLKISKGGIFHLADHLKMQIGAYEKAKESGQLTDAYGKPVLNKKTLALLEMASRTLERLQKTGCVALGIPDKNTAISGPGGGPIKVDTWVDILALAEEADKSDAAKGSPKD